MKNKINDGHYLELMDRLHVIACTLDEHCIKHPLAQSDKEIKFRIDYALGMIMDAYQYVGQKDYEKDKKNEHDKPIHKVILRRHKNSKK